tara:strand:+ start:158 stop:1207 length:1050 start_codon:yes stop_codon:yes gene_type:complete
MKAKFIIDKKVVLKKYNEVKEFCDYVSYSSKTNPLITKILEENTDSLFSIHLINELNNVQDKNRIVFLAQAWNSKLIEKLLAESIKNFVVDNESDLNILLLYLENHELNQKINLFLRIKLKENTLRTEKYFVFGMTSEVVNKRIQEITEREKIKSKINQLGLHFHRKTQNMSEWNLQYEISQMLTANSLNNLDLINIGGGLPSVYANTNVKVLPGIFKKIMELKNWLNEQDIKLVLEPGRFIAAPAGKLVTEIVGIHERNIVVNASVYNSDLDALIVPVKLKVENELSRDEGEPYVIKGITPCSMDLFRYRVYLNKPQIGDTITFINAGAYNFTTEFCDLEKLETEVIE